MKIVKPLSALICCFGASAVAADVSLTIYNQNFAQVQDRFTLSLSKGLSDHRYQALPGTVQADSLSVASQSPRHRVSVVEQNYRSQGITDLQMLARYQGQILSFEALIDGQLQRRQAKVLSVDTSTAQVVVEQDGLVRFDLPGTPLFGNVTNTEQLSPAFTWRLQSSVAGDVPMEVGYLTNGLHWQASYQMVVDETRSANDSAEMALQGRFNIDNQTQVDYLDAAVRLLAGQVHRQPQPVAYRAKSMDMSLEVASAPRSAASSISPQAVDSYHVYKLPHKTDVLAGQSKQVSFLEVDRVRVRSTLVYDGSPDLLQQTRWLRNERQRNDAALGRQSQSAVAVYRTFNNQKSNHLGMPLPAGPVRFYQRNADGDLTLLGENTLDHTAKGKEVRLNTGDAFDVSGVRKRVNHHLDSKSRVLEETYQVTLSNGKNKPVKVAVREHLFRWPSAKVVKKSDSFQYDGDQTIVFPVTVAANAEYEVNYTVRYQW